MKCHSLIAALWMLSAFFIATMPIHAADGTSDLLDYWNKKGFHPAQTEAEIFLENLIKNEDLFIYQGVEWINAHNSTNDTFFNKKIDLLTYFTADMITSLKTTPIRPETKNCPNHYDEPECGFIDRPIPCTSYDFVNFYKVIKQDSFGIIIANMHLALYRMVKTPEGWRLDGFKCLPAQPYDIYPFSGISFNMPAKHHGDIR